MAVWTKKILLIVVLLVLLFPRLQRAYPIFTNVPLNGFFEVAPNTKFTWQKWFDGSYQEEKDKYLNDNMSFGADLIWINCQIDYSLFYKLNTGWAVLGKDKCLLDWAYIAAYNGADFVGYDTLRDKMWKLKAIQDTLAKLGKTIVLVHAASKAFYYHDDIPGDMLPDRKRPTNFATCLRIGDSLGVNQLDFNTWFCRMKDTSKELLYPKQGLHWSYYGGLLASDSIVHYLEHMRHIKMLHPRWDNIVHTTKAKSPDDDLVEMLNLIYPFTTETFTYGNTVCDTDHTATRLSAIYIGDSFYWDLVDNDVFDCINSKWEFWYYFKERYTHSGSPRIAQPMENYDWVGALNNADYIVLLYTAPILDRLGSGFIEKAYDHYYPGKQ